ncbi:MAG: fibronectin type III domain-containing protein [Hormoscilla sp.]
MPRFPTREDEIASLANDIIIGLENNPSLLTAPIVDIPTMRASLENYRTAKVKVTAAQAAVKEAVEEKDELLADLVEEMKQIIRQAENETQYNDTSLKKIGWGGRTRRTSIEPPGQVRNLEAPRQGAGWVVLDWKTPSDGGKVVTYKVQMFDRDTDSWKEVTSTLNTEATLVEQERTKTLEYRVIAINRAGEGAPSNTVLVNL